MTAVRPPRRKSEEARWRDQVVIPAARLLGWKHYFTYRSTRSPAGFLDLVLCRPPRLIIAELKTDTGTVSREQRAWLDCLGAVPACEVYVWRPSQWREIERILQAGPAGAE